MTIERTTFVVDVEGEGKAVADAAQVERAMDRISQKAKVAEADAARARTRGGALESLLMRARQSGMLKRGGLEYGAIEFNRQGFGLNKGFLRGAGGGVLMAPMLTAALAHGTASTMEGVADIRDALNSGKSGGEIARSLGLGAARGVLESFAVTRLAEQSRRLFGGASAEQAKAEVEQFLKDTFTTREELAAEDIAQRKQARRVREAMQKAMAESERQAQAELDRKLAEIDAAVSKRLAGIKNETLPVGLDRRLARAYHDLRERQVKSDAEFKKSREREQAKLGPGEGD